MEAQHIQTYGDTVLRVKFIVINTYIKKNERHQIKHPNLIPLRARKKKKEQGKLKTSRRK